MTLPIEPVLDYLGIEVYARKGDELEALCPFHDDSHPSWSISTETGYHHCFSCGAGGGFVGLVMALGGFSFPGAKDFISEIAELDATTVPKLEERIPHVSKFELPEGVEFDPIDEWADSAREYLLARITKTQATRWRIGYALSGRLGGRIVLPIRDEWGRVLSYVARTFTNEKPKYMTPRDREKPIEGALFGQEFWRGHKTLIVTEAAFDALAAERAIGTKSAVAAIGGADLTPAKLSRFSRFAKIVIATDADRVGDRAADEIASKVGRHVEVRRARPRVVKDLDEMEESDRADLLLSVVSE